MSAERAPSVIVTSMARAPLVELYPPEGTLPSLIDDARENPLVRIPSLGGEILVKTPAFPYVAHHALVIPDLTSGEPTPDPTVVPDQLLSDTFQTAGEIATHYLENPSMQEVNIGWNHSRYEDKKHVATQQKTLHVHVVGYTNDDLEHTVSAQEIQQRPELKMKEHEPLAPIIKRILEHDVFGDLEHMPAFEQLFSKEEDGNRVTYELRHGADTFKNPALADLMKRIHALAKISYDSLAECFFTANAEDSTTYQESEDGRYQLLPREERISQMNEYLETHDYLGSTEQRMLKFLARNAKSMDEVNGIRHMGLKGLAYATSFAGIKQGDGTVSWRFGIDPVAFAPRDVVQASRGTFAHFERNGDAHLAPEQLAAMKIDEQKLTSRLTSTS